MAVGEDLSQIEDGIRRLQIEWDKFFSGIERKPPSELKARVEALIRRWANEELRNNTERFRYQTLTARYNTFAELWNKKLRAREEGKAFGVHGLKAETLPPPPPPGREALAPAARPGGPVRIANPGHDVDSVRRLYDAFIDARAASGEGGPVKFESFQKLIGQQTSRLLGDKAGQSVEFRLETADGKVSLKAKVVK